MALAFITGSVDSIEAVRTVQGAVQSLGFELTHDWTKGEDLGDHEEGAEEAGRRAAADLAGVLAADVYVFCSDNAVPGRAMYAELGAALASLALQGRPEVYLLGARNFPSVFYFHPDVRGVDRLEALLEAIQIAPR